MKIVARRKATGNPYQNMKQGNQQYQNTHGNLNYMNPGYNFNQQNQEFNQNNHQYFNQNNQQYQNNKRGELNERGNGYYYEYLLDDGTIVSDTQAYEMAINGQLEGIMGSHNKGRNYIRTIGDGKDGNDLNDLPTF